MRRAFTISLSALLLLAGLILTEPVLADDTRDKASTAVTSILFDYEVNDYVTYSINDDGFVDIIFPSNTPDKVYGEILNRLQQNPDIDGVLASKGGPFCHIFN